MQKRQPFSGVITAIITPFQKSKKIDLDSFHKLIVANKKFGINGIVVLGSTGEAATLNDKEAEILVSAALEHKTDDFQILVGSGTNCTQTTKEKSKKFSEFSAHGKTVDGLLIVTPYYNKPHQEHLVYHYKEVCEHIPQIPVCVYNVPSRTGINMHADTFAKIAAQNNNVVAIKEAAGNMNVISEMRLALNSLNLNHIRILSGDDGTFAASLLHGGDGIISVTSQLIPKIMCDILTRAQNNDWNSVKALHLKTFKLHNDISCVTNPIGIKFLLSRLGFCENVVRAPLYSPNSMEEKKLDELLADLKSKTLL